MYDGIEAFHGCRTSNVGSYWNSGIRLNSKSELIEDARKFLKKPGVPQVSERALIEAFNSSESRSDEGTIHALIDERHLLEFCGTYLIYGSENLRWILSQIKTSEAYNFADIPKRFGQPTCIRFTVDWSVVPRDQIDAIAGFLAGDAWSARHNETLPITKANLELTNSVPHESLKIIYHPNDILDPTNHYRPYHWNQNEAVIKRKKSRTLLSKKSLPHKSGSKPTGVQSVNNKKKSNTPHRPWIDSNYKAEERSSPLINKKKASPKRIYWLRLDGSFGG